MSRKRKAEYDPLTQDDFSQPPEKDSSIKPFSAERNEQIRNAQLRRDWRGQRDKEDAGFAQRLSDGFGTDGRGDDVEDEDDEESDD